MSDFPKKILDKVPEHLIDEIPKMTEEELRERIVKSEAQIVDNDKEVEDDTKLLALKEELKALTGAYRDHKKAQEATIKYCIYTLRSRGIALK